MLTCYDVDMTINVLKQHQMSEMQLNIKTHGYILNKLNNILTLEQP